MSEVQSEFILAEEQDVVCRTDFVRTGAELQGTLILTNQRLIFVPSNEELDSSKLDVARGERLGKKVAEEGANLGTTLMGESTPRAYIDVDDLSSIPQNPNNLYAGISSLKSISGHKGIFGRPNLRISWTDKDGTVKNAEFQQSLTGRERKKNLNDWASVILKLKAGHLQLEKPANVPGTDTLEGKIFRILGDLQTKGALEIETEVETRYGLELDPADIEDACEKLVSTGLVEEKIDPTGDNFYKRLSPLKGEDDLSI